MMNLIAISLMAASLAVTGLFSPSPHPNEQVIIKDGHRAVVVEYADTSADGNTKVSISPAQPTMSVAATDESLSRAAASVAGVAQDVKGKAKEVLHGGPRELICDAYGKCKHKVAGVLGMAKEGAQRAEEAAEDAVDRAKGIAEETAEGVKEKVHDAKEKVKETGERVKGKTEEVLEETKEKVKEKGRKGKKELSDIAKRGKEVIWDVIGYVFGVDSLGRLMNLMGFAMAYGIGVWVTFVESYVLAGVLPRQQFGMVQSKVYPVYFKAMLGSIGLALLGHLLAHRGHAFKSKPELLQGYNLLSCLLLVLANVFFLEPPATKAMLERMKLEKEEGRGRDRDGVQTRVIDTVVTDTPGPGPATVTGSTTTTAAPSPARREDDQAKMKLAKLNERLKKLNSYSSLLNISTMMGLTWHLVYLSRQFSVNS